jgi:pimeloyl-ACP methyl ester carboxylesterase
MHVIERGPAGGRPLVLLHGVGTGARGWTPQLEALSGTRQVLAPDLPGFGESHGPFTIAGAVEQLRAELERRDVERIDLCGLSLGALVALEYAAAWTEQVASLTVCAGFARLPAEIQGMQTAMVEALRGMPPEAFPSVIVDMTRAVPEPYRAAAHADISGFTHSTLADVMAEATAFDITQSARFQALRMPTLILYGEHDAMNAPMCRNLANLLQAELERVPDAGHVANLDAPEAFNALLRDFLDNRT